MGASRAFLLRFKDCPRPIPRSYPKQDRKHVSNDWSYQSPFKAAPGEGIHSEHWKHDLFEASQKAEAINRQLPRRRRDPPTRAHSSGYKTGSLLDRIENTNAFIARQGGNNLLSAFPSCNDYIRQRRGYKDSYIPSYSLLQRIQPLSNQTVLSDYSHRKQQQRKSERSNKNRDRRHTNTPIQISRDRSAEEIDLMELNDVSPLNRRDPKPTKAPRVFGIQIENLVQGTSIEDMKVMFEQDYGQVCAVQLTRWTPNALCMLLVTSDQTAAHAAINDLNGTVVDGHIVRAALLTGRQAELLNLAGK